MVQVASENGLAKEGQVFGYVFGVFFWRLFDVFLVDLGCVFIDFPFQESRIPFQVEDIDSK